MFVAAPEAERAGGRGRRGAGPGAAGRLARLLAARVAAARQGVRDAQQGAALERGQPGVPAGLRGQGHAGVRQELPD